MVRLFSHWWLHVIFHAPNFRPCKASNEGFTIFQFLWNFITINMLNHAMSKNNNNLLLCRYACAATFNFSKLFFLPLVLITLSTWGFLMTNSVCEIISSVASFYWKDLSLIGTIVLSDWLFLDCILFLFTGTSLCIS